MTRVTCQVFRDESGTPSLVVLKKGGKKLEISEGSKGFILKGSLLPDFVAILSATAIFGKNAVDIAAQTVGNINVDINAQSVGNLQTDIVAQTIGNLDIDIAAQSLGNLAMEIAAQTVDLDIKTSGGTNIIIDKLNQGAYTERQSTLENPALATPSNFYTDAYYRSKFYPRGCRGWIESISIRARNTTGGDLTINFAIAPNIGMGDALTFTATVPAGADGTADITTNIRKFWNYDSMWIHTKTVASASLGLGYITGTPYDGYYSSDLINWVQENTRSYISVTMKGETVGDVPVSGTVNNINIPNTCGVSPYTTASNDISTATTVLNKYGSGHSEYLAVLLDAATNSHQVSVLVYTDDVLAFNWKFSKMTAFALGVATPKISLLQYGVDAACSVLISSKFEFKRNFQVKLQGIDATVQTYYVDAQLNLIS